MNEHLIADILYGPAKPLNGATLSDEYLARIAAEDYAGQNVRVVRHWLLLDVVLPEHEQTQLAKVGMQPTVLYACRIVHDSHAEASEDRDIVTGYESESIGCVFNADDTTYILAGPGGRKFVSLPAVTALRNHAIEQGR
ncbi:MULTISPECIES: DUF6957 family protein [Pseudomonas putida group]|uniref:DUF6957 family protein n=1 Tax=Pseudomonas putida group TaxID=136845 RepID=UPI0018AB52DE|nr:hypothetical protein [Pseudomonas fulva]MBF8776287.1 hypothetical protein [Pseudomonas fulva]